MRRWGYYPQTDATAIEGRRLPSVAAAVAADEAVNVRLGTGDGRLEVRGGRVLPAVQSLRPRAR